MPGGEYFETKKAIYVSTAMADLYILGELHSANGFDVDTLFCRYSIQAGPNWSLVSGDIEGQTAADTSLYEESVIWAHPIDIHYISKGLQGWPKIQVQVHCLDSVGRSWVRGYSFAAIPCTPGHHKIDLVCWLPSPTSIRERLSQFFLGGANQLLKPDILYSAKDRYKIVTQSMGNVTLNINVVLKDFKRFGVEYK